MDLYGVRDAPISILTNVLPSPTPSGFDMFRRIFLAAFVISLASACVAPAGVRHAAPTASALPATVADMLNAAGIPKEAMGAVVIRLSDGATVLSHRPDASMQPGSTMKLVTTIVGLEKLGPTKRWQTELRTRAPLEDGVLRGDVILLGGGDGTLTWEELGRMLQSLREKGIRDIRGDLILDRGMFQPTRTDVGIPPFDEETDAQYNVIPDALLINTNLLKFDLESDDRLLHARMTPNLEGVSIDMQIQLVDGACEKWDDGWQVPGYGKADDGSHRVQLRGTFPRNCSAAASSNVLERNEFIDRLFRTLWTNLGGTFEGTTREGVAPGDSRLLARHRSRTLADMLREINKPSDNPLSRLMFLTLGTLDAEQGGSSLDKADRQIRGWLNQLGIPDDGLVTENGSGLSRKERIRPSQLAALLAAEYRSDWAPEFLSSLPIVGLDGTMRKRLRDSAAAGRARMKTGTLKNVVALAGYVPDAAGQMHVVVAMINFDTADGKLGPLGRPILDALADSVARSALK